MACVVNFEKAPEYCAQPLLTNTKCPTWNAAMTSLETVLKSGSQLQGVMYADLATCQTVPSSSVVQSGVTISQVKLNNGSWPGEDVAVSTDLCAQSRYPVFDQSTGQVAKVGDQTVDTRKDLWTLMSQACTGKNGLPSTYASSSTSSTYTSNEPTAHGPKSSKRKASYMDYSQDWSHDQTDDDDYPAAKKRQVGGAPLPSNPQQDFAGAFGSIEQNGKQQVSFTYSCKSPADTCYTQCRMPGFDYVDKSTTPWSFTNGSNKSCGKAPVPTITTNCDSNSSPGNATGIEAACATGCCVPTFQGSNTCALCGNATLDSNLEVAKLEIWSNPNPPSSLPSTPTGYPTVSLAYTGQKGIAITPISSYTGDVSTFGDPTACYPGNTFDGLCTGLQGCTGNTSGDVLPNFCEQGLSNFVQGPGPAYNCPNLFTLSRQQDNCPATTTNCDGPGAPDSLSGDTASTSTITYMFVPEGAYVTGWYQPEVRLDAGNGICSPWDPNNTKYGIQLMCGRESIPSSTTSTRPPLCQGSGYQVTGYSNTFKVDSNQVYSNINSKQSIYSGDVAYRDGTCGCYFKNLYWTDGDPLPNRGYQGFTFGFMPGYYKPDFQTNQGSCY